MSILNVNTIQPIGSGTTVTVAATELKTSNFITVGTGASVTSPSANVLTLGTNNAERFRITSAGLVGIGTVSPSGPVHAHTASGTQRSYLEASASHSFLRLKSGSTSYNSGVEFFSGASNIANINGLGAGGLQFEVNGSERFRIDSSGNIGIGTQTIQANTNYNTLEIVGDTGTTGGGIVRLKTGNLAAKTMLFCDTGGFEARVETNHPFVISTNNTERLRITSAGVIQCGTSATLKAEINNSVSGHQFISQCSDNNNGFEVYQQHASNTTRNNFAVYANTGSSNAKNLQFAVRGDGAVTKPGQPLAVIGTTQNNLTPSTGSIIQFDYVATNRGNHYNTSNYTFTCPVAGDYMVILRHSRKGWVGDLDFEKNGTTHAYLELRETGLNGAGTPVPDWQAGSYSFIVPCAANDVLRWKVGATYTSPGSGGYLLDGYNHIKYDAVTYYLIG